MYWLLTRQEIYTTQTSTVNSLHLKLNSVLPVSSVAYNKKQWVHNIISGVSLSIAIITLKFKLTTLWYWPKRYFREKKPKLLKKSILRMITSVLNQMKNEYTHFHIKSSLTIGPWEMLQYLLRYFPWQEIILLSNTYVNN